MPRSNCYACTHKDSSCSKTLPSRKTRAFTSNPDLFSTNQVSHNHSIMNSLMIEKEYGRFFPKARKTPEIVGFNMKQYEEELIKLRNDNFSLKLRIHLLEEKQGLELRPGDNEKENVFRVNIDLKVERETLKQQIEEKSKVLREALDALEQMESDRQQERSRYEDEIDELRKNLNTERTKESSEDLENGKIEDISANSQKLLFEAFGSMNLDAHSESDAGSEKSKADPEDKKQKELTTDTPELDKCKEEIKNLEEKLKSEEENVDRLKTLLEERTEELNMSNETQETLNNRIDELDIQVQQLTNERNAVIEKNNALGERYEQMKNELSTDLERKDKECGKLMSDKDTSQNEIISLSQKNQHLEQELRVYKQESQLAGEKIQGLNYELDTLKVRLNQERQDTDTLKEKARESENLKAKLSSERMQISTFEENQEKAESCITGLTQLTIEQKQMIEKLNNDVYTRDQAIDKLTTEYEKVKAKVRKYRSMKEQFDNQAVGKGITETTVNSVSENMGDSHHANDTKSNTDLKIELEAVKKGRALLQTENWQLKEALSKKNIERTSFNISDKENLNVSPSILREASNNSHSQRNMLKNSFNEKQHINFLLQKGMFTPTSPQDIYHNVSLENNNLNNLQEEVQMHKKEIALLKGELQVCKTVFMKTGASRAMEKVEKVYSDQITKVDHAHGKIVGIMRKRLEELAECIQKIIGSANGNISSFNTSRLSTGDVSALSDILNESRRLSKSFFTANSLVTVSELAAGDQNQSLLMELNEGEISNTSALIDPNETQLPTGILKFPTNEIIDGINKEIDEDFYTGGQNDKLPSPKSPMDIVNNRLKEYEELIRDLNEHKKQKSEKHHELVELKKELSYHLKIYQETKANLDNMQNKVEKFTVHVEQLQNETEYWKMETEKRDNENKDKLINLQDQNKRLENDLLYWKTENKSQEESQDEASSLKTRLAETNNILEDLRINYGQTKERLRESMRENVALKSNKAKKKEAEKGLEQLCMNYQEEIEELKRQLTIINAAKLETIKTNGSKYESLKAKLEWTESQLIECQKQLENMQHEARNVKSDSQNKLADASSTYGIEIQNLRNQLFEKDHEAVLMVEKVKSSVSLELDDLKKQLRDAEQIIAKYKTRQEKVDRKLRSELAKTHTVLKKTKVNLDKCKE